MHHMIDIHIIIGIISAFMMMIDIISHSNHIITTYRAAEKEASRLRLAKEFPVLFNNCKPMNVNNNKRSSTSSVAASLSATTPFRSSNASELSIASGSASTPSSSILAVHTPTNNKRKISSSTTSSNIPVGYHCNDENAAKTANNSHSKLHHPSSTSKIPLSSKKSKSSTTVLSNKSNAVATATAISEGKRVSIDPRGTTTTTEQKFNNKFNKLQQQKIANAPLQSPMPPCVEPGLELCSFNLLQEANGAITSSSSNYLLSVSEDEVVVSNAPSFHSPVVIPSEMSSSSPSYRAETVDAVEEKGVMEVQCQLVAEEGGPVEGPATTTNAVAVAGLPMVEEREEDEDVHVVEVEVSVPPQAVDVPAVVEEAEEEEVQEHIMDVMDFLLESNEIDAATHHRLSSFSFSADTIKRLSVCSAKDSIRMSISNNNNIIVMLPSPLKQQQIDHATEAPVMMEVDVAAAHHDDAADPSITEEDAVAVTPTDAMIDAGDTTVVVVADYSSSPSSSSSSIAITTEEEEVIPSVMVSTEHSVTSSGALLATELSSEPLIIEQSSYGIAADASSVSTESASIDAVIHGEVVISSTTITAAPIEGESSSSFSSSMPCLDEKSLQAEDVLVALRNFINNLDKNMNIVEDQPPTKRVSDDGFSVLSKRGRSSCDESSASETAATAAFTHRSSIIHLSPSSRNHHQATTTTSTTSKVSPHKQARLDDQATAAACEVMTYPLSELLDDALERGLVCVDLVNRCDSTGRVQYLLQTQVSRSTIVMTMMIDDYLSIPPIYSSHITSYLIYSSHTISHTTHILSSDSSCARLSGREFEGAHAIVPPLLRL